MNDHDKTDAQKSSTSSESGVTEDVDAWTRGEVVSDPVDKTDKKEDQKTTNNDWEKDTLNRLAFAAINEQRRSRRWGIFFKSLFFIYLFVIIFYIPMDWSESSISHDKHTALIDLEGVIAANTQASADNLVGGLRAAFKDKKTAAVIMRINSPGGSPVQAGYVFD